VNKLSLLDTISVEFDSEQALASATEVRDQIQQMLEENPVIVPIQFAPGREPTSEGVRLTKLQQRAGGGMISGPGTGTSDDVLLWGSNGEGVVTAKALQRMGGAAWLNRVNALSAPKFAGGGVIGKASEPGRGANMAPVNLTIPGIGAFPLQADRAVVTGLTRAFARQALKTGRTRP
ncbi:unnamed protein product, partial [marine sediment metagenome]